MTKTWKRNVFVLLAAFVGLVIVGDVQGQIFGRRRRARAMGRPIIVAPAYGYGGWYQGTPAYSAPATVTYGNYGTYGGTWNYAPAYESESRGTYLAPGGTAGFGSVDAGVVAPGVGVGANAGLDGGVVGAAAAAEAGPSISAGPPPADVRRRIRDIPGQSSDNRPLPEADLRRPADNGDRLVPLQGDRRETTPDDRRNLDDAPPPPPAP